MMEFRKNLPEKNYALKKASESQQSSDSDELEKPAIYEFHKFMLLPGELRDRVYYYALVSDGPILPHLCTKRSGIKFHDDNNDKGHNTTSQSLAITRISKLVRQESFPIFYNENTFAFGTDTPAYFERLTQLGRFHMVHHVSIPINFYSEENGARAMRDIRRNIIEQEKYENSVMNSSWWGIFGMDKKSEEPVAFHTDNLNTFMKHPVYQSGGLSWMGIFFVLRKLSAAYTARPSDDNHDDDYERELVLRVPNANMFAEYELLRWFPKVAASMGIKLKFVDGGAVDFFGGGLSVQWVQKYQKKDALRDAPINPRDNDKILRRALDNFPRLNTVPTANTVQYYRVNCETGALDWCKVQRC
ncbi:hypothetical protein K505DRAFT_393095 [Melanomma pulvis-pyrius CBS 109.77]|uniref:Uncharacterized protein n=1 Tax=Melanomma pulvis-pyrius CBS 109.77 TaxID=1314802 RepID=A0A6A6XRN3_9PLEO|nr:hypothetical protein K505DRAFT_393095 [Melanomma pulvis-pyrius CBS 109.77]